MATRKTFIPIYLLFQERRAEPLQFHSRTRRTKGESIWVATDLEYKGQRRAWGQTRRTYRGSRRDDGAEIAGGRWRGIRALPPGNLTRLRRDRRRTVVAFHRPFSPSISSSPNNDSSARSACAMRGRGRRRYKKRTRGTHGKGEERKQGSRSPAAAAAPASSQHLLARMSGHGNVSLSSLLRKKSRMMNRTSADSKPPESNQIRVFFLDSESPPPPILSLLPNI